MTGDLSAERFDIVFRTDEVDVVRRLQAEWKELADVETLGEFDGTFETTEPTLGAADVSEVLVGFSVGLAGSITADLLMSALRTALRKLGRTNVSDGTITRKRSGRFVLHVEVGIDHETSTAVETRTTRPSPRQNQC